MTAPTEPRQRDGWRCCATCDKTRPLGEGSEMIWIVFCVRPANRLLKLGKQGTECSVWSPRLVYPRPAMRGLEMRGTGVAGSGP